MTPALHTILVVDDELANRKLLETLLQADGYITIAAASGAEALAAVEQHQPSLILLDVMMPGMDGYHVARVLKGNPALAAIPIIMVSALRDRDSKLEGLNSGAEDFLTKPIDRSELWLKVRNRLRLKASADLPQNQGA